MRYLTHQEIFDQAMAHMRAQGRSSTSPISGACVYRQAVGDTVLRCAAGVFIPDSHYAPAFDSAGTVRNNLDMDHTRAENGETTFADAMRAGGVDLADWATVKFVSDLQTDVHDRAAAGDSDISSSPELFLELVEEKAQVFAATWNLTYVPPASTITTEGEGA